MAVVNERQTNNEIYMCMNAYRSNIMNGACSSVCRRQQPMKCIVVILMNKLTPHDLRNSLESRYSTMFPVSRICDISATGKASSSHFLQFYHKTFGFTTDT